VLICYVDESGCTGILPSANSQIQPAFCILGLAIDQSKIQQLTLDFLQLKRLYFRNRLPASAGLLDWVLVEIKGSDLRATIRNGNRKQRRHTIGFLDAAFKLIEAAGAKIFGKVFVKGIGDPVDSTAIYTRSLQNICEWFQNLLSVQQRRGFVIADSRNKPKNTVVSHAIFTQKFRFAGDVYPDVLEMATFGHSDNHIGLQLTDLICSGIVFPMVMHTYCLGIINSVHVSAEYNQLKQRFCTRVKSLQHRFQESSRWVGGIVVSDRLSQRHGGYLFR